MRHWTAEERKRQSELIRTWRPWERSTGPKTPAGKIACTLNPLRHGLRSAEFLAEAKRINKMMRDARGLLRGLKL